MCAVQHEGTDTEFDEKPSEILRQVCEGDFDDFHTTGPAEVIRPDSDVTLPTGFRPNENTP